MAAAKDEAPDENDDRRHRDERRETMASPAKDEAPDENENRRHQRDRQTTAVSGLLRLFEGSSRFFGFPNSSSSRASGRLSHVGRAAVRVLKWKHPFQYRTLWNTSAGRLVSLDDTPKYEQFNPDRVENHSEWFPEKVGELIAKTEIWCDIVSLGPPDGDFLYAIRAALEKLHVKDKVIIIRIMFGNIVGMPVNCKNVMKRLIKNIPKDSTKLRIWMGSWRRGITWNHAKFIAVDGRLLHTGGHNFWTRHYLRKSPVFDLSVELAGPVAHDGHVYANYPVSEKEHGAIGSSRSISR